jgi:hypothetical protein
LAKVLRYDANLFDRKVRPLSAILSTIARKVRTLRESKLPPRLAAPLRAILSALLFLACWAGLNAVFNNRYPARALEKGVYYLLPSVDVCLLLVVLAILGWRRRRLMFGAVLGVAVFAAFVRLYRISDGLIHINYFRDIKLYVDMPLLPDLWRLLRMSVSLPKLLTMTVLLGAAVSLLILLTYGAIIYLQSYLARSWRERTLFVGVLVACAALSPLWKAKGEAEEVRSGLFIPSVAPVAVDQARFASSAATYRRAKTIEIRTVHDVLQSMPADFSRLKGADFLLLLVESYGSAVFRQRTMTGTGCPNVDEFTSALASKGYGVASKYLLSTTYGGGSWFAHATLRTGVAIRDSLEFSLILQRRPPPTTFAEMIKRAGYRTVLAQPGTTRAWPEGLVHGFDRRYYAFDMEYEGPTFGWATMPDQYLLHVIHNKELKRGGAPRFIEYALVSSHAPWTPVPVVIDDWSKLERGRIYQNSPGVRFPVSWTNMEEGAVAYSYSLCYEFDVMRKYITERLERDAFIVILGDHQPPGAITYDDPSWAVPMHVASKDQGLIERFVAAGYTPGMIPAEAIKIQGLNHFVTEFVRLLSSDRPSTALQTGEKDAADPAPAPGPSPPDP